MSQVTEDALALPTERLEQLLAAGSPGREGAWAEQLGSALEAVVQALQQHTAVAEGSNGLLAGVDLTRPTLARQVAGLRQEHRELLDQVARLWTEVGEAGQTFRTAADLTPSGGPLPEPADPRARVPDFGDLRRRGQVLVEALKKHRDAEASLTIESVTTDLGAGD